MTRAKNQYEINADNAHRAYLEHNAAIALLREAWDAQYSAEDIETAQAIERETAQAYFDAHQKNNPGYAPVTIRRWGESNADACIRFGLRPSAIAVSA